MCLQLLETQCSSPNYDDCADGLRQRRKRHQNQKIAVEDVDHYINYRGIHAKMLDYIQKHAKIQTKHKTPTSLADKGNWFF